jgi:glycosyltransferase involved in cell wall biosynthesis
VFDSITPIILTHNEAANIERTLEKLQWAEDIVVVDSFSSDETLEIIQHFPQARVLQRAFDCHAAQWNFALHETCIKTEWVLALDADSILTDELISEIKNLIPDTNVLGYKAKFRYCINGYPLRGTLYPPVTVLYRREKASYRQDGHTQQVVVEGKIEKLKSPMLHDDRKPLSHWVSAQNRYMKLEAEKLLSSDFKALSWADRLRRMYIIAPFAILFYCLFMKGAVLDGRAGLFYAFQRMFAELLLSLHLLQDTFNRGSQT